MDIVLREDIEELHWMARRYADGRATYLPSHFNAITRRLIAAGFKLDPTFVSDKTVWAKDAHGRAYDGLTGEDVPHEKSN